MPGVALVAIIVLGFTGRTLLQTCVTHLSALLAQFCAAWVLNTVRDDPGSTVSSFDIDTEIEPSRVVNVIA
jgi:hypothetical protein